MYVKLFLFILGVAGFSVSYGFNFRNLVLHRKNFIIGLGSSLIPLKRVNSVSVVIDEKTELKRLMEEKERLTKIFESQKMNINSLPKLEYEFIPSVNLKPLTIITKIIKDFSNKSPEINKKAIKTIYNFLSSSNPYRSKPFRFFNSMLQNTKYNIIIGNFDNYEITTIKEADKYAVYDVKLETTFKKLMINNIQISGEKPEIIIRCLFSKDINDYWLIDGMFIKDQ